MNKTEPIATIVPTLDEFLKLPRGLQEKWYQSACPYCSWSLIPKEAIVIDEHGNALHPACYQSLTGTCNTNVSKALAALRETSVNLMSAISNERKL
jgi:hypothetical protein